MAQDGCCPLRILGIGNARSIIFLRWAWRLRERGHEVHVISDRFPHRVDDLDGIEAHDIRELELLTRLRGVRRLRFGAAVARYARANKIDVVHGHYLLPYGYWAALAGRQPLVISPWGTDILIHGRQGGRDQFRAETALRAADALVVNSEASRRAAIRLGGSPDRIEEIVWYANLQRFSPSHRDPSFAGRFGWPADSLVLLSLRNYRPDTNIDVIVRAFAEVRAAEPRARLLLAAKTGPLRSEIEQLVTELGLAETVAFCAAEEEELPVFVSSSDLLLAMTSSDSTPSSLLEAMASGLPPVCADAASIDEWIVPGRGGEIVPRGDSRTLARTVLDLLADRERRAAYAAHNLEVVASRLPFAGPGADLERLYRSLVATRAVSPQPVARAAPAEV